MTGTRRPPLRIAMLSNYLPSGSKIGVGYQVHALANGLVRRGHDVTVFSASGPSDGARYTTVKVPLPRGLRTFAFAWRARRLDFSGFDILHAHGDDYWMWRGRVPAHVRTMHGSCFEEARRVPSVTEKLRMVLLGITELVSTAVADRTVLVSPQTARWMPWVHSVIPNGVDEMLFSADNSLRDLHPTILFVGTYRNRKRGRLLMDVFAREVLPHVPDARLVMVCDDAPSAPGVTVTGRIPDDELAALYRSAWIFCLPSTYEGFGIPYAEALMAGLPVVATPNPGSRYVLGDSDAGLIVDDARLGATLTRLLTDPQSLNRVAAAARPRGMEFSLSSVLERYEDVYAELLDGTRIPRSVRR